MELIAAANIAEAKIEELRTKFLKYKDESWEEKKALWRNETALHEKIKELPRITEERDKSIIREEIAEEALAQAKVQLDTALVEAIRWRILAGEKGLPNE